MLLTTLHFYIICTIFFLNFFCVFYVFHITQENIQVLQQQNLTQQLQIENLQAYIKTLEDKVLFQPETGINTLEFNSQHTIVKIFYVCVALILVTIILYSIWNSIVFKTIVGKCVFFFYDSIFTLVNTFCPIFEKVTTQTFCVNFTDFDFELKVKIINNTCAIMYRDPSTNGQFWSFKYFLEQHKDLLSNYASIQKFQEAFLTQDPISILEITTKILSDSGHLDAVLDNAALVVTKSNPAITVEALCGFFS